MQVMWNRAAMILLLGACTPFGLWIYEDPVVTVHRLTFELRDPRPAGTSPVVVLAVENRNDYPLSAERVELSLRMDGIPIGRLKHDSPVAVATDTISTVAMPLSLERRTTREQIEALSAGTHLFAVRGRATFRTPIGTREVRFAQEGSMVFGQRSSGGSP
jgi:LEA14-like dessication related protein